MQPNKNSLIHIVQHENIKKIDQLAIHKNDQIWKIYWIKIRIIINALWPSLWYKNVCICMYVMNVPKMVKYLCFPTILLLFICRFAFYFMLLVGKYKKKVKNNQERHLNGSEEGPSESLSVGLWANSIRTNVGFHFWNSV